MAGPPQPMKYSFFPLTKISYFLLSIKHLPKPFFLVILPFAPISISIMVPHIPFSIPNITRNRRNEFTIFKLFAMLETIYSFSISIEPVEKVFLKLIPFFIKVLETLSKIDEFFLCLFMAKHLL